MEHTQAVLEPKTHTLDLLPGGLAVLHFTLSFTSATLDTLPARSPALFSNRLLRLTEIFLAACSSSSASLKICNTEIFDDSTKPTQAAFVPDFYGL